MIDKEKVIEGLNNIKSIINAAVYCDDGYGSEQDLNCLDDAITLLEEQEKTIVDLRNVLQLIADIAYDYDGYNSVEGLKSLIDEIREMALQGVPNE